MKLNPYLWQLYKESEQGKRAIELFDLNNPNFDEHRIYDFFQTYFEEFGVAKSDLMDAIETAYVGISDTFTPESMLKARELHQDILSLGLSCSSEAIFAPKEYSCVLAWNIPLSQALYFFAPEYFFPNFFPYQFVKLIKIFDLFDIELPKIPQKSDYKARCEYYMDLCGALYEFRTTNGLTPPELCAFLYDFAQNLINVTYSDDTRATQAWLIGGKVDGFESERDLLFWQGNAETRKGDIVLMYETAPVSAITSVWIAQTNGVIDPFFHYYSNIYIDGKIEIPNITLQELRSDDYFSTLPIVKKNFQGVNGWPFSGEDYSEFLRVLINKGFDTGILPQLYAPSMNKNIVLSNERDVEEKLLEYYLSEFGISKDEFIRQLPIKAGRGSKIYPDYALFYDDAKGYEKAKILIEAKLHIKTNKDVEDAFQQARSYANILESSMIILCDKHCLLVYEKTECFDRSKYKKYFWSDLESPDGFNEFKKLILRYR